MSNSTHPSGLTFLRWNLDPQAAALWHHAAKQIAQRVDARLSWIEVDAQWNSSEPLMLDGTNGLHESAPEGRLAAFIVGIDRTRFLQSVSRVRSLREFCNQVFSDSATNSERMFLIAWFPHADRVSMQLLRELGCDLVLHDPASLKPSLTKIILCNATGRAYQAGPGVDRNRP